MRESCKKAAGGGLGGRAQHLPPKGKQPITTNPTTPGGGASRGGLRGPRRGSVKGGALGAEEGEAGAGLG